MAFLNEAGMNKVKVSVIMPTYNSARFIKPAIESILSQTFQDFEFIIIDDLSRDGTLEVLHSYAQRDNRMRIIRNEKYMGLISSLNRGIRESTGEYIARMDSDDIAIKDRLEKQALIMETNPDIYALGGAITYIDASGNELGVVRHCDLNGGIKRCPLIHSTVMIRKEILLLNGFHYDEKYRYAEDYFLWLQIARKGKISAINDVVTKYRLNSNAAKIRYLKRILRATLKVKKDAIFILNIKPAFKDIIVMLCEAALLLLPAQVILFLYLRKTFGKRTRVIL
ncbi:MAG: glycosyltransferase [Candidatus Omnitrophica bacterium]|nr:glycosyltransferase [Candidatus Omnitrophota bacterium]